MPLECRLFLFTYKRGKVSVNSVSLPREIAYNFEITPHFQTLTNILAAEEFWVFLAKEVDSFRGSGIQFFEYQPVRQINYF